MNLEKLFEVYEFAKNAHQGQKRQTGEDYISHPIAVANIMYQSFRNESALCACLLHDVVEDTTFTLQEITERFGEEVSFLVDGVTKEDSQEKTLKKVESYSLKDNRVIRIKLADRIHNMYSVIQNKKLFAKTIKEYKLTNPVYIEIGQKSAVCKDLVDDLINLDKQIR